MYVTVQSSIIAYMYNYIVRTHNHVHVYLNNRILRTSHAQNRRGKWRGKYLKTATTGHMLRAQTAIPRVKHTAKSTGT